MSGGNVKPGDILIGVMEWGSGGNSRPVSVERVTPSGRIVLKGAEDRQYMPLDKRGRLMGAHRPGLPYRVRLPEADEDIEALAEAWQQERALRKENAELWSRGRSLHARMEKVGRILSGWDLPNRSASNKPPFTQAQLDALDEALAALEATP